MNRINWIDWGKTFCITIVVYCHTPQPGEGFFLQYWASVILSTFFFISGYLKKPVTNYPSSFTKYTRTLVLPYMLYNLVYYPYWLIQYYIKNGGSITFADCIKPIIGTFLFQQNSTFSAELNGVTWFLIALFLMHITTDICCRQKKPLRLMLTFGMASILLYGANKYYHYAPNLAFNGFVRCLCFFFMGNIFRRRELLKENRALRNLLLGLSATIASMVFFYWHIHEPLFPLHILLFYVVNLLSVLGIVFLCKSVNHIKIGLVTTLSVGTLVIMGLHRIVLGCINYGTEKALHIDDIHYPWFIAVLIAVAIDLLLLPVIRWGWKHPLVLGKSARTGASTAA